MLLFWPLNILTLDLGIFGHVKERPAQGGGCGLGAGHKQIQNAHDQVFLIKRAAFLPFGLETYTSHLKNK